MRTDAEIEALVNQWQPATRKLANQWRDRVHHSIADDIESVVFEASWIAAQKWDAQRASFSTFLYRTVGWQVGKFLAQHTAKKRPCVGIAEELVVDDHHTATDARLDAEVMLSTLSPRHADLMRARFEGHQFNEIAAMAGVSKQRVHQAIGAAVERLQRRFVG